MADWDTFAGEYDDIFLENPQYRDTIDRMLDLVEGGDGKSFVDIGGGTGNLTEKVLERFPDSRVLGVDPSEGMREVYAGRFRQHPMVSVVEGSALAIPSGDGEFDLALSNLVLHHVPPGDRDRCAAELARVLKPGGTLIYGDMFCDVDGPPEDPARCRDIIDKMVAAALYCLDQGAYEMMMIMLKTLPMDLREEGEHLTTESVWLGSLERAGFGGFEIVRVPPEEAGVRIIRATSGV